MSEHDNEQGLDPPLDELTAGIFRRSNAGALRRRTVLATYALAVSVTVIVITALVRGSTALIVVLAFVAFAALGDLVVTSRRMHRRAS